MAKTKGTNDKEKQARVDELLANPNRQPADDAELDKLLHGEEPVVTGDVSVDPVGVDNGNGLTSRAVLRGEGGDLNVYREVENPNVDKEEPAPDATEAGASTAGSNETKRAGAKQPGAKSTDKK